MPGRGLKSPLTAWSGHRDDREGGYESRTVENCLDGTEVVTAWMERRSRAEPTAPVDGGRDAGLAEFLVAQCGRRG